MNDVELLYTLNSDIMISVSAGSDEALKQISKLGIPSKNLLGFVGTREPVQKLGIKTILGTLGNLDQADTRGNDEVYLTDI